MKSTANTELLKKNIFDNIALLEKSALVLDSSLQKCRKIGLKDTYSLDELESFESLTSRFSRTCDLLTQKVIKNFLILLQENLHTIIDKANYLEKVGIIDKADDLIDLRELRNSISHEYIENRLIFIFSDVLDYSPDLFQIIEKIKNFAESKFK
ncbi:MAG: hypothetical protein QG635_416 [Bacteroidota bacterium]|nr:hypothetical protein [Bacteroidota bacterium]